MVAITNYVLIKTSGSPILAPTIPRDTEIFGNGKPLRYVVLGDSTTIAQGADYADGYVRGTADYLARLGYRVELTNVGISGATASDVAATQATNAGALKPDVALVAVGANDVTHLTRISTVRRGIADTIDRLRAANPDVKIVITGSPQMGSVPRFPQPSKLLARLRTNQLNRMAVVLATVKHVVFAPIAAKTGAIFDAHPEYYAADNFHPNAQGYALWTPVLNAALSQALRQ
jgi:lysophospholipase L1-like esterase